MYFILSSPFPNISEELRSGLPSGPEGAAGSVLAGGSAIFLLLPSFLFCLSFSLSLSNRDEWRKSKVLSFPRKKAVENGRK